MSAGRGQASGVTLKIRLRDLDVAASGEIISKGQARALWKHLGGRSSDPEDAEVPGNACPVAAPRRAALVAVLGVAGSVVPVAATIVAPNWLGWHLTPFERALLSGTVGVVLLIVGFWLDGGARRALASTLYVAGLAPIVFALATVGERSARASSERVGSPVAAILVGAALTLLGLALRRRSFGAFAAIALSGAVGHLADGSVGDGAFSFTLVAVGIAVIAGACAWRRAERIVGDALVGKLPSTMRRSFESRRSPHTARARGR